MVRLNKSLLPALEVASGVRLNKALLPPPLPHWWESVSKALKTHKYIHKYRYNGRWVYVYRVGGLHVHTHWNHEEDDHHTAPDELRSGRVARREGAKPKQALKVGTENPVTGGASKSSAKGGTDPVSPPFAAKQSTAEEGAAEPSPLPSAESPRVPSCTSLLRYANKDGRVRMIRKGFSEAFSVKEKNDAKPYFVKIGLGAEEAEIQKLVGDMGLSAKFYAADGDGKPPSQLLGPKGRELGVPRTTTFRTTAGRHEGD